MATNQARTALCVLFCIFLGLSLQQVNLTVTEPCKYLDPNSISCDDSNSCTGMIHFHEKQANDLFSRHQYKFDLISTTSNEIRYITNTDLNVKLNSMIVGQNTYKDKAQLNYTEYGFIRIPFRDTTMALSKMYSQIPEKSYLFVPYAINSTAVLQTNIKILLREYFKTSALNTNSATTGTGTIITRVKNLPDTARGVVLVAPVIVNSMSDIDPEYTKLTMGEDSQNGFPSGTESEENEDNQIFYTNCKIIMDRSSERIKDFSEEQEYVRLELPSSIVTSRSTSSSG